MIRRRKILNMIFKGVLSFVLILSVLSCTDDSNWMEYRGRLGQAATNNTLTPPLAQKWKLQLQLSSLEDRHFNSPIIEDGIIYFGSADSNFYALDIETGYMKWIYKTSGPINSIPLVTEDRVVFGSGDGYLYALSKEEGNLLWTFRAFSQVNSTISAWRDKILCAGDGGSIFLLDLDGNLVGTMDNSIWSFMTFVIDGDVVHHIPGGQRANFNLGAYNLAEERFLYFISRGLGTWTSSPAINGDRLFYSVADFRRDSLITYLFAQDKNTGEILWQRNFWDEYGIQESGFDLAAEYSKILDYLSPALFGDLSIWTNGTPFVRAIHQVSDDTIWEIELESTTTSSPIVSGDRVYFGIRGLNGNPGKLLALDASSGQRLWEMPTEGDILSAPVIAGDWMVFGTSAGQFYVLEEVF